LPEYISDIGTLSQTGVLVETTMAQNVHLLIVEDEPLVADVLREILEAEYRVSCAKTAAEAFAFLRTSHIDIALVDSVLPDGPGGNVAEFAEKSGVAVIAMSGHPQEIAGFEHCNAPHLQKPFGAASLLSTVAAIVPRVHRGGPSNEGMASRAPLRQT
jgi:DNA-binding response OmpR family regulator